MTRQPKTSRRALTAALGRFRRDDRASLSVEAVLILPLLLWAFMATYSFFDVYRAKNLSLKGNYAVSDLLSREASVDAPYLLGAEKLFKYLTQSDESSWLRVTVVRCANDCDRHDRDLRRDWSHATDNKDTFSNRDIMKHFEPIIPWIAPQDRVIIVETGVSYEPPFPTTLTGIRSREFVDIVMTRPRFTGKLCWNGGSCGN